MAGLDALQLIQDALAQPLPDDETRRVVSCLDVAGSSGEGFDRLMGSDIGYELMRSLTFEKAEEGFSAIRDFARRSHGVGEQCELWFPPRRRYHSCCPQGIRDIRHSDAKGCDQQ